MRTSPQTPTPLAETPASVQQPVKVCMVLFWPVRAHYYYYIMRRANTLMEAGFAVSVVDIEREATQPVEEIQGVRVKHMIAPGWFIFGKSGLWTFVKGVLMTIRSMFLLLQTDADIYHAYELLTLPACYLAARLRRKPLVFDTPEPLLDDPSYTSRPWLYAFATRVLATLLPHCAGVIVTSSHQAEAIRSRYHTPDVTVLRNVSAYQAVSRSNRIRQYLGLSANVRILLYNGYLASGRGLDKLIRAARFLESNIVIVMKGNDHPLNGIQSQLEALIASEGVTERVKIIPVVPYEEMLDWIASADIGCIISSDCSLGSRWFLPQKLFEYLMAGLPVLSPPLDAITEIIRTYDVGQILPSLEPADIGAAINAMLADSADLERMRCNALEAAKREFHWENESQQLIRLYRKILAKQSKQRRG